MIRRMVVIVAAIAMPVSLVAASSGVAGAAKPVFNGNATNYTISCKNLTGTVTFSKPLNLTGYTDGTVITTTVSGTLTGCKASKAAGKVVVSGGTISGSLKGQPGTPGNPSGTCTGLLGNTTEGAGSTLSTTWSGSPAITSGPTVLHVAQVSGGTYVGKKSVSYGQFQISGALPNTASGSFQGSDAGASDLTTAATTLSTTALAGQCASGLSSLGIVAEKHVPIFLG